MAVEVAEEAAGEAVAGAGRVAHVVERDAGKGEEAVRGEEGRAVLALLGDDGARAELHRGAGGAGQVRLAGQLADLGVVDDQAVDLGDRRQQRVLGGVDPEVHRVQPAEARAVALGADLALQVWLDVGEEEGVGGFRLGGELRLELAEDAELGVLGVGDVEVVLVATAPEERLAALDPLDVAGLHAAAFEHLELGGAEVLADRADRAHLGEEAGGEREMDGGAAQHAVALPEGVFTESKAIEPTTVRDMARSV